MGTVRKNMTEGAQWEQNMVEKLYKAGTYEKDWNQSHHVVYLKLS